MLISSPHDTEDLTMPDRKRQICDSGDELEMPKNLQFVEMVLPDGREGTGIISVARIALNGGGLEFFNQLFTILTRGRKMGLMAGRAMLSPRGI